MTRKYSKMIAGLLALAVLICLLSPNLSGRTSYANGQAGGVSAFGRIEAESYTAAAAAVTNNGTNIGNLNSGGWVRYSQVDFGNDGAKKVTLNMGVPAAAAGRSIEIRLDALNGTLIGTLVTQSTGGFNLYGEQAAAVKSVSGIHDVYLVCAGSGYGYGNLDWLQFTEGKDAYAGLEAEAYNDASSTISSSGNSIANLNGGSWVQYRQVDFGVYGAKDAIFRIAVPAGSEGRKMEIRLDALNGPAIGALTLQSTGGYSSYTEQAVMVDSVGGVHDLFLVFIGTGYGYGNLDWFRFNREYSITDTTPPHTSAAVEGEDAGGFYQSGVTVTLSAYDYYAGVAQTLISLDNGVTWQDYVKPVSLIREGAYQLQYRSLDRAGNLEEPASLSVVLANLPAPVLFYTSTASVLPGDAVLVKGEYLDLATEIRYIRLNDGNVDGKEPLYVRQPKPGVLEAVYDSPRAVGPVWGGAGTTVNIAQQTKQSLKFFIPGAEQRGVYAVRLAASDREVTAFYLNAPEVQWVQGDQGVKAAPGGFLRINGKNLATEGGSTQIVLESVQDHSLIRLLPQTVFDGYSVEAALPGTMAAGEYKVYLHNGYGGDTAWSPPVSVVIEPAAQWPAAVFNVKDFGAAGDGVHNDTAAVLDALDAARQHGGGIIYFPGGRYHLTNTLKIPPYTVVRGESRERTQIFWSPFLWDMNGLPDALMLGTHHFAVEDISIYASRAGSMIVSDDSGPESGHISIERIRVRAIPLAGHVTSSFVKDVSDEIDQKGEIYVIRVGGENVRIMDSDLYGADCPIRFSAVNGGMVKGNTLYTGYTGWYSIGGSRNFLFEDNKIIGAAMKASGGGVNNLGYHSTENYYFARNTFERMFGNDREPATTDGGGGVYFGPAASVSGTAITLPDAGSGVNWTPNTWKGAGVFILTGKGAGQYRTIVSHTKDTIVVDSPFAVNPDASSVLTVTGLHRNGYYVDNEFTDTGAFQFYGTAINMVMSGNKMTRGAGIHAWGLVYGGYQPDWYVDIVDNEVVDGNYFHWYGINDNWSGASFIRATSQGSSTLNMGTLIRRNRVKDSTYIHLAGGNYPDGLKDAIVEGNRIEGSARGIVVEGRINGVLLHDNTFAGVEEPLVIDPLDLDSGRVLIVQD
ncbi:MAG: hypothetical protein K0R57_5348 [Paenibacillaceae bacterium]|jgi:hypothetical protein|nr:hypothetical protein [Paenibacillaceae bacterium]